MRKRDRSKARKGPGAEVQAGETVELSSSAVGPTEDAPEPAQPAPPPGPPDPKEEPQLPPHPGLTIPRRTLTLDFGAYTFPAGVPVRHPVFAARLRAEYPNDIRTR